MSSRCDEGLRDDRQGELTKQLRNQSEVSRSQDRSCKSSASGPHFAFRPLQIQTRNFRALSGTVSPLRLPAQLCRYRIRYHTHTVPCMPCQHLHMSSTVQQSAVWRLALSHLRLKRCTSQHLSTGESHCATPATPRCTGRIRSPQQAICCTGQKQPRRVKAKAEENGSSKSSQEAALQVRTKFCLMLCPPVIV